MANPKDTEEMALTLNGRKKRISRASHHDWKEYQIRNKGADKTFENSEKAAHCNNVPH